MHTLSLPYPDDLLITSGNHHKHLKKNLLFYLRLNYSSCTAFSLGKAAQFCNMTKL